MFCIVPIISILMIHHMSLTETLTKMGTGVFGESSSIIKLEGLKETGDIINSVDISGETEVAVYLDKRNEDGIIRYIYFNGKYVNLPMREGRFFKKSDFKENNYQCIIGKERKSETYEKGNKSFIKINDLEYRVLGVVGYEKPTVIDNYIFVNMYTLNTSGSELLSYDFFEISNPEKPISNIRSYLNSQNINSEELSGTSNFSENVIPKFVSARWFILLLIACFLGIWLISMHWIEKQKRDLSICRVMGASKTDIGKLIISRYLLIYAISFFIGIVYCNVIYPAYFSSLLTGYFICIGFIFLFLVYSILTISRVKIEEAMQ